MTREQETQRKNIERYMRPAILRAMWAKSVMPIVKCSRVSIGRGEKLGNVFALSRKDARIYGDGLSRGEKRENGNRAIRESDDMCVCGPPTYLTKLFKAIVLCLSLSPSLSVSLVSSHFPFVSLHDSGGAIPRSNLDTNETNCC